MTQSISHTILNENDTFNITHAWSCAENWILKNKIPGTRFWIFALNDEWSTFLKSIYQKGNINHWLGRAVIHQNHPSKSSIKKIHQNHPTKSSIKSIGWVVFRNFTYPSAPLRAVFLFSLLSWWKSLSSWKSLAWYLVKDGWDQNHRSTSSGEWYLCRVWWVGECTTARRVSVFFSFLVKQPFLVPHRGYVGSKSSSRARASGIRAMFCWVGSAPAPLHSGIHVPNLKFRVLTHLDQVSSTLCNGVATVTRIDTIIGLFYRISSLL